MDSKGSQVPPVPARLPSVREGWGGVDLLSDVLKILGWIALVGGIVGGIAIAANLGCGCTGSIYCDCEDQTGLQAASVIGGVGGGLATALLFWSFAFILDMLEAIWFQTGGRRPHSLAILRKVPERRE